MLANLDDIRHVKRLILDPSIPLPTAEAAFDQLEPAVADLVRVAIKRAVADVAQRAMQRRSNTVVEA